MKKKISIQFKAVLLLIVLLSNTIIGFACAVGMEMPISTTHQHHEHNQQIGHQHTDQHKENCCTDEVVMFEQSDKTAPQSVLALPNPIFFSLFITTFHDLVVSATGTASALNKYYVRNFHPPIPDIRIAIQSFQI